MNRRTFLTQAGTVVLILPAGRLLTGCGDSNEPAPPPGGGTNTPSGPSTPTATELDFTSSVVNGHSHDVTIQVSMLSDSPAGGDSLTTTNVNSHTHELVLTEAELDSIQAGQTVTRETSLDAGHTHTFALSKSATG